MEPCAGGNIIVGIGMMHLMHAPQETNTMKAPVRDVVREIERQNGGRPLDQRRSRQLMEETPSALRGDQCEDYGTGAQHERAHQGGKKQEHGMVAPSLFGLQA